LLRFRCKISIFGAIFSYFELIIDGTMATRRICIVFYQDILTTQYSKCKIFQMVKYFCLSVDKMK